MLQCPFRIALNELKATQWKMEGRSELRPRRHYKFDTNWRGSGHLQTTDAVNCVPTSNNRVLDGNLPRKN